MTVGEPFVIDAQDMENGGMQVVDVDGILGDVVAIIVGSAIGDAFFDAGAGKPVGKTARMMVPAKAAGEIALREAGPAELAPPDHQRVFEKAATF